MRLVIRHIVIGELQGDLRPRFRDKSETGLLGVRRHAEEIDLLEVSPLVSGGHDSIALELCGDPVRCHVAALLSGAAALQGIVRKILHRGPDLFRVNGVHYFLRVGRHASLSRSRTYTNDSDEQNYAEFFHCSSWTEC